MRRMPRGNRKTASSNRRASSRRPPMVPMSDVRPTPRVDALIVGIGLRRSIETVPSVIVARVGINPRLAVHRPLRACPVRPRAKTRPRLRVSVGSRQMHEFVAGDGACAFGSSGTELDRRFVQTYRHPIAVARTRPYLFAHSPAALAASRAKPEAMLHAARIGYRAEANQT